jgi:hypothetical protein
VYVLGAGVALLSLPAGGAVVVYFKNRAEEEKAIRLAMRAAAKARSIDPAIMEALPKVESGYRMGAKVTTGTDGARGGAWGPTQITEKTARAHGYTGPMVDLTTSPELAAEWTARILAARPGGAPKTIADAGAWWNAGKTSATALPAGHITARDYIPKATAALDYVRRNEVA